MQSREQHTICAKQVQQHRPMPRRRHGLMRAAPPRCAARRPRPSPPALRPRRRRGWRRSQGAHARARGSPLRPRAPARLRAARQTAPPPPCRPGTRWCACHNWSDRLPARRVSLQLWQRARLRSLQRGAGREKLSDCECARKLARPGRTRRQWCARLHASASTSASRRARPAPSQLALARAPARRRCAVRPTGETHSGA